MVRRKAPSIVTVEHHLLRCPECGARHWLVVPVLSMSSFYSVARPDVLVCGECGADSVTEKWEMEAFEHHGMTGGSDVEAN